MANTYFNMEVSYEDGCDNALQLDISLTAFMGGTKSTQLTLGGYPAKYILLSDEEAKRLSSALMERVNNKISATGWEKSEFTDIEEDENN